MAATDDPDSILDLEKRVGNPDEKWRALIDRVQDGVVKTFVEVQDSWLDLMWTLDRYRTFGIVPRNMGNPKVKDLDYKLAAIYRTKGNWYAELISLLLGNQTAQKLAPRTKVRGFSQLHQIDVAWPDRNVKPLQDPRVCLETKLTGAPPYGKTVARAAMSDWSNRRKELKFAATDLKLARRGLSTEIDHWDVWRETQDPLCYFLWGARLTPADRISKMVSEVQGLNKTYLDGAGVFAWREAKGGSGYEAVAIEGNPSDRVSTVDDVLRRISSHIKKQSKDGRPPELIEPEPAPIDVTLFDDLRMPGE